jgi:hypothetical protein
MRGELRRTRFERQRPVAAARIGKVGPVEISALRVISYTAAVGVSEPGFSEMLYFSHTRPRCPLQSGLPLYSRLEIVNAGIDTFADLLVNSALRPHTINERHAQVIDSYPPFRIFVPHGHQGMPTLIHFAVVRTV